MPLKKIQLRIRTQLTLVILLVTTLAILALTFLLVSWGMSESRRNSISMSNTIAKLLGQDSVQVMLFNSADSASDLIVKLNSYSEISAATFFDKNNVPLLNYDRSNKQSSALKYQPAGTVLDGKKFITTYVKLQYQNHKYGTAGFQMVRHPYSKGLFELLRKELYLFPLLIIFSYLLAVILHQIYTEPLERMVQALRNHDSANDVNLIDEGHAIVEMNELANSFNGMVRRVGYVQKEMVGQKQRLHVTLDAIADGVIATDCEGIITFMNPAAEHICGWSEKDAIGRPLDVIYQLIDYVTFEPIIGHLDSTLQNGIVQYDIDNMALQVKKGGKVDIKSTVSPIRDSNGEISGAVVTFQNITEMRVLNQKLKHQAIHDPLTSLINRGEFERLLEDHLTLKEEVVENALMYLDLDQFKVVNDTSGHIAGDSLLKQIAALLQNEVRETDVVARLGGDEFAILLPHCNVERAQKIAETIRQQISSFTFVWESEHFRVGISIGIVPIDQQGMTKTEVLTKADMACYAAKDLGRNRVHLYTPNDKDLMHRRDEMQWLSQISNALDDNRLFLFGQRVIPLNKNSKTHHIEVLVRHIDSGSILRTPGAFIPAIERYGMASKFDRWIIQKSLENPELINYLKQGNGRCVNINLSGLTLGDTDMIGFVSNLLSKANLPPRSVCFEITETAAVANFNATAKFIKSMKLLGCDFALDDFGSGVSSFAYLKNLPVEYLKIDGSLIRDIDQSPINEAMVSAINQIGHVMKMKTVAEFVENGNIQDKLVHMGVDYAQGYHVHMPAPLQDVIAEESRTKYGIHRV